MGPNTAPKTAQSEDWLALCRRAADGAEAAGHLHPRVEPEIGILLARDLGGTGLGIADVAAAVAEVRACLEVVDSIWLDYRFTAAQNTADGSSASGVVVGPVLDVDPAECHAIPVELVGDDGAVLATATSGAAGSAATEAKAGSPCTVGRFGFTGQSGPAKPRSFM